MNKKRDLIVGLVVGVFAILYYIFALKIRLYKGLGASVINSAALPKLWAVLLFILSVILILRSLLSKKSKTEKKNEDTDKKSLMDVLIDRREVVYTFVLLGLYVILVKPVGFIITTVVYIFCQTLVLTKKEKRNYIFTIILGLIFSIGLDYLFVRIFSVLLPKGIIGF